MSGLIEPKKMNFVSKRWGWELWICNSEKYCGKKLFVKKGHNLSYHHHELKDEVLFVESGKAEFIYGIPTDQAVFFNATSVVMEPGHAFHVEPGLKHQIHALEDTVIFEFSTQHFDSDSHRTTMDLVNPTTAPTGMLS